MKLLDNPVRRCAWGSADAIPRLLGTAADGEPQAELWLGAHERLSSSVRTGDRSVPLGEMVASDPAGCLGAGWAALGRMPFLAKVIAVAQPLSLQVHPGATIAERGYQSENRAGLGRDHPRRNFPDPLAKTEMVFALEPFAVLCGFRPLADMSAWLDALAVPALKPTAEAVRLHGRAALADVTVRLLACPAAAELLADVSARCTSLAADPHWSVSAQVAGDLARRYPDDPAVALALLLEPRVLAPGEAMLVQVGQPHTYLRGTAVEVQANSDNVLRAGLTEKHVDVTALAEALDTGLDPASTVVASRRGCEQVFAPPTPLFALALIEQAAGDDLPVVPGPQIFCCTDGSFDLADASGGLRLRRGQAAFAAAGDAHVRVRGSGQLLRVSTGRAG